MKKILSTLFISLSVVFLFPDDLVGRKYYGTSILEFTKDRVVKNYNVDEEGKITKVIFDKAFCLSNENGITFLNYNDGSQKNLILYNDYFVALLSDNNEVIYSGIAGRLQNVNVYIGNSAIKIDASSYLKEQLMSGISHSYIASNLRNIKFPWVEGVTGPGNGEKLYIEIDPGYEDYPIRTLWLFNGYISFERPELYSMNNRVKSLRIISKDTGYEEVISLFDSPNSQPISIPYNRFGNSIVLEIVDTYAGTKFDDTCISTISCTMSDDYFNTYGIWMPDTIYE